MNQTIDVVNAGDPNQELDMNVMNYTTIDNGEEKTRENTYSRNFLIDNFRSSSQISYIK